MTDFPINHKDFLASLPAEPTWLTEQRRAAFARFQTLGFPTRKHEDWKYTRVKAILQSELTFPPATLGEDLDAQRLEGLDTYHLDAHLLVFLNGHFRSDLSSVGDLPSEVQVLSMADAIQDESLREHFCALNIAEIEHPFEALNIAFTLGGAFIHVPADAALTKPIHLLHLSLNTTAATLSYPRHIVVAGERSEFSLIESYQGLNKQPYFTCSTTDLSVAAGAIVKHYKFLREDSERGFHIARVSARQERDSTYSHRNFCLGGRIARNDIDVALNGRGVTCTLDGLYLVKDNEHIDNHTRIDHAQPHCNSFELYKGILSGDAVGVFNGKVFVHQDAQKTDAKQSNKNLLLSPNATINTKPQLEIWADDVKCTHGATIGKLDEEALFYMQSRGIPRQEARGLLTFAFANDVIQDVKNETLRELLENIVLAWLPEA